MVVIFDRGYFGRYLKWVYDEVFTGQSILEGCFRDPVWRIALLPGGLNINPEDFQALADAARSVGDTDYVITEVECVPPHSESALLPWSIQALEYVRTATAIQMYECAMFGLSRRWGVVVGIVGDGCTIVGGEEEFMKSFTGKAGGVAALDHRFRRFADVEWSAPEAEKAKIIALLHD